MFNRREIASQGWLSNLQVERQRLIMNRLQLALAGTALLFSSLAASIKGDEPRWKQHTINGKSEFEAAGVFDVDNDGKFDIVSGDTWYRAPDWTSYPVRNVARVGTYFNDFATHPLDMSGDGNVDFITCSYFGKSVGWVENPGKAGAPWTYHEVDVPGNIEASWMVDLSGDGVPGISCPTPVKVAWSGTRWSRNSAAKGSSSRTTTWARPRPGTASVREMSMATAASTCSLPRAGSRPRRILLATSWAQWHPDWQPGATGIQILARDVDGDGLADVVYGMGHNYGLFWLNQTPNSGGDRTWTKQAIDNSVASVHALTWADIDGDGKAHELVTGKRVYAHEIEPGATDGSLIAWYAFDPTAKSWAKHVIFQGEPARNAPAKGADRLALKDFPAGTAGTGLQLTPIDIDRDGDLDLVCPGKSGLYLFENLRVAR